MKGWIALTILLFVAVDHSCRHCGLTEDINFWYDQEMQQVDTPNVEHS